MLKIKHCIEPWKKYPKDQIHNGRLRIKLKGDDGEFLNPEFKTKEDVMLKLGEHIPKMKERIAELQAEYDIKTMPRHKRKKAFLDKLQAIEDEHAKKLKSEQDKEIEEIAEKMLAEQRE